MLFDTLKNLSQQQNNNGNQTLNSNEQTFGSPSSFNETMTFGSPSSSALSSSYKGNSTAGTNKTASSAMFSRPYYYE